MKNQLDNSILFRVTHAANLLNSSFNHLLQPFDIGIEQRITLEFIKNQNGVKQSELSKILVKDKTTISRTLRALEAKGLIEVVERKKDKRTNKIKLTNLGEEILKNSSSTVNTFRNKLSSNLSNDERAQLFSLLEKVLNPLEEEK